MDGPVAMKKRLTSLFAAAAAAGTMGVTPAPALPTAGIAPAAAPAIAAAAAPPRTLRFHNLHTEEQLTVTYWRDGQYDVAALAQIGHLLRDHRRDEDAVINPELLDYLHEIQSHLRADYPRNPMVFQVVSGYRARETTDALRQEGAAVARDTSQHQLGQAMDFRIEGIPLRTLRDVAWCLQRGGVGYYPERDNNFIHVDVGRVRFWPASRRAWACMS
jgi:uncharacterized protein YcbK (DUF882 family)